MLAIGKALMAKPEMLVLDEPSLGLAPIIVEDTFDEIRAIRDRGVSVLMVEQHVEMTLELVDYAYVLELGHVAIEGSELGPHDRSPCPRSVSEPAMRQLILQSAVSGLLVGGIYGLVALGLALSFGVLKVLNVAHGELVMLGGYAAFFLFTRLGVDPLVSIPAVFLLLFVLGVALYWLLFKFVVRFDIETRIKNSLLISFGLVLILQAIAVFLFSGDDRTIVTGYSSSALVITGWVRIPWARSAGLVVAVIAAFALEWLLNRTTFGHAVRGTSEDWSLASLTGIDVRRVYMIAFAISAGLAGLAGSLVSLGYSISPSIGLGWTLKALIVIVLAGLGSMRGIVMAGALLGLIEGLASVWVGSAYRGVVALVVFLVVLSFRPQGLFGREGTHV